VGIATGLVVIGDVTGNGQAAEHALAGETPLLAAQLLTLATPGAVVISNRTRRMVGRLFECRDLDLGPAQPEGIHDL
jgi:class 3 adenylate cyclase